MSMIGLLAGAPQAANVKTAGGDATGAEGFGSTLQEALDALVEAIGNDGDETEALPTELPFAAPAAPFLAPSLPTVPAGDPLVASASSLPLVGRAVGSETPRRDATPAAASSTVATTPLVELVESATGNPVAGPADSVSESSTTPPATPTLLVGTPTGNSTAASANSANVAAVTAPPASPAAPPANAPSGAPTSTTSLAAPVVDNSVPAPLGESPTTNPPPASMSVSSGVAVPAPTTTLRETPVSTPSVQAPTSANVENAPAPAPATATVAASTAVHISAPPPVAPGASVAAPVAAAPVPFSTQLARPIFSLAAAGTGEHVMTVSVTPDNLGPVTVRAHVGADGVRVELFAPNDLGRDAIRAIIPDLRRDLAGAGLGGNLSLSSHNQPSAEGSGHGSGAGLPKENGERAAGPASASADGGLAPAEQQVDRSGLFGTTSTIDVLA